WARLAEARGARAEAVGDRPRPRDSRDSGLEFPAVDARATCRSLVRLFLVLGFRFLFRFLLLSSRLLRRFVDLFPSVGFGLLRLISGSLLRLPQLLDNLRLRAGLLLCGPCFAQALRLEQAKGQQRARTHQQEKTNG